MSMPKCSCLFVFLIFFVTAAVHAQEIVLKNTSIVQDRSPLSNGEIAAKDILSFEIKKRTGLDIKISNVLPSTGDVIILKQHSSKFNVPAIINGPELSNKPESYRIVSAESQNRKI